jgi:Starch-binding associating with outer membrane/Susd and RagB outer membrane lipoprotein
MAYNLKPFKITKFYMKNKFFKSILTAAVFLTMASCKDFDLDSGLNNPNEVSVAQLDQDLLMNQIETEFAITFQELTDKGMALTRMIALTGDGAGDKYENVYLPTSFNDMWRFSYQRVLNQIEVLLPKTDAAGFTVHSGAARVLKAYTLVALVDAFGDIPYSQALKGIEGATNFNPGVDKGKDVYDAALKTLDLAIVDLNKAPKGALTRDIYFGGNAKKWIALANTIKLKMYLNTRLVDAAGSKAKITELLAADLIDTDAEEFTFKYANSSTPARSRHPLYIQTYKPSAGSASGYIGNYFMLAGYNQKGVEDPRWRYYFNRQVGSIQQALKDDPKSCPCTNTPRPDHFEKAQAWCTIAPGFYGRDHLNTDGTPPDSRAITAYGVYPAGGASDLNKEDKAFQKVTQEGQGAGGAGIEPIWMASFTDFLKAEAALTLGTTGDAGALLKSGVTKSINRVRAFAVAKNQPLTAGLEPAQAAYEKAVDDLYAAATTPAAKLNVIMKEYYLALFGNGLEAYNMYRRTGMPLDMQPARAASPGNFFRTFLYPSDFVNLNSSTKQKADNKVQVFWDNNPAGFVK